MIKLVGDWRVLPQNVWKSTHAQGSLGAGRRVTGVGVGKLYRKLYRKLYWKLYRKLYWNNLDLGRLRAVLEIVLGSSCAIVASLEAVLWGRLEPSRGRLRTLLGP